MVTRSTFDPINQAALAQWESLIRQWLPDGKRSGDEWQCLNPLRADNRIGSFSINLTTGAWADFATGDKGGDPIALYAYLFTSNHQGRAARELSQLLGLPTAIAIHAPAASKRDRTPWQARVPVPIHATDPPKAHITRGLPDTVYTYRALTGEVLGYVYRFRTSDGGKETLPLMWAKHGETRAEDWRWLSFPVPRPLYRLETLLVGDTGPVLVVEGEKCADAANKLLKKWAVVSWPGGGKAVHKVDWSPLAGREVWLWPDCDAQHVPLSKDDKASGVDPKSKALLPAREQPGQKTMNHIAQQLNKIRCTVHMVQIPEPGDKPHGWDIADAIDDGMDDKALELFIQSHAYRVTLAAGKPEPPPPQIVWEEDAWRRQLIRNIHGRPVDCRENVFLVLHHHPAWRDVVGLDEFSNRVVKRKKPPFDDGKTGEWDPTDDLRLGLWLAQQESLLIKAGGNIADAVNFAAAKAVFHPVRDYLDQLRWDDIPRLSDWLTDFLGVAKSDYSILVGRFFLLSMIARIYKPGCPMRAMPILEGSQFQGKSTSLRILGGEWFGDTPFDIGDKDAYQMLRGKWLYEIAELDAFNKSEVTRIKSFISSPVDTYRAPYERRSRDWPRQVVFAGTTNQDEYLKDSSGNTRYWPLRVHEVDDVNLEGLQAARDQLFAEAVCRYREHERWHPSRDEQNRLFDPQQEQREIIDPWYPIIYRFLAGSTTSWITTEDLIMDCLKIEVGKISAAKQETMRIGVCMKKMGWKRERKPDGARSYFYARPNGWPKGEDSGKPF